MHLKVKENKYYVHFIFEVYYEVGLLVLDC